MASTKVCNNAPRACKSYNNTSFYNDGMTKIILHDTLIFKIDRSSVNHYIEYGRMEYTND